MHHHHAFLPDLRPCTLEARVLPAYSPFVAPLILTTGGYVVLSNPPGLNSALGNFGGAASYSGGGAGGNIPTSFNISGFGPSSFAIGNSTGFPSLNSTAGGGSTAGGVGLQTTVGSGANTPGGGGGVSGSGTSSGLAANGTTVSSGYNTGLSGSNAYGTSSTSTVGSVPVHTYDTGVSGNGNTGSNSPSAPTNAGNGGNAGTNGGNAGQGPTSNYQNSLLGQRPGGRGSLLSSPDDRNN